MGLACDNQIMQPTDRPTVMILCGGRGTRLRTGSEPLPKPLVEIGGMPVLWHVVQIYAAQGFKEFQLLTGHQGARIEQFAESCNWPEGIAVRCIDTGEDTLTGGRVAQAAQFSDGPVCITYADGVADIDLADLVRFHCQHQMAATMTLVRPELPFGIAQLDGDRVTGFVEKPQSSDWINGGFMVFERRALAAVGLDDVLERAPLASLAADGQLAGFRHQGFWDCMDTYKDQVALNDLWQDGRAPWVNWS